MQPVNKEELDWLEVLLLKAVLKSAIIMCGAQSVMISLEHQMLTLSVDS